MIKTQLPSPSVFAKKKKVPGDREVEQADPG